MLSVCSLDYLAMLFISYLSLSCHNRPHCHAPLSNLTCSFRNFRNCFDCSLMAASSLPSGLTQEYSFCSGREMKRAAGRLPILPMLVGELKCCWIYQQHIRHSFSVLNSLLFWCFAVILSWSWSERLNLNFQTYYLYFIPITKWAGQYCESLRGIVICEVCLPDNLHADSTLYLNLQMRRNLVR